ncbi:MAG: threonine/serine dehydratase [Bacteroidetes bacterium]|nr:threonine/serine dehydratase [Bacteroidota bacterium]
MTHDLVRQAAERLKPFLDPTPVLRSDSLTRRLGSPVFIKCELFQPSGSFKIRGALNAVLSLSPEEASRGVITHSSGNHGTALAVAAASRGLPCTVVMPQASPQRKINAVREAGARVVFSGPSVAEREEICHGEMESTGAVFIHPSNDPGVIAGQGTAVLELLTSQPSIRTVLVPVGGGGLLAGTILGIQASGSETVVVAAEPARAADAYQSLKTGQLVPVQAPDTIADGLRSQLGDVNFPIIRQGVGRIVLIEEDEIRQALSFCVNELRLLAEPSSVVPLAALLTGKVEREEGPVGIILTGGNHALKDLLALIS